MGRDARLAEALDADNRGNRGRLVVAHGTCNQLLAADLRIEEYYRAWVEAQERYRRHGPPAWAQTTADLARVIAAMRDADIEQLAGVLRAMGVPWRWCAEALVLAYFPTMRYNETHPDDPQVLRVSAGIRGLPTGQAPPHGGDAIAENVRWWYRHKIKHPTDSSHALAREYATREKRHTDAHSVIQTGIVRAELLLNGVITP